jgi:nucleoporin p58/p45
MFGASSQAGGGEGFKPTSTAPPSLFQSTTSQPPLFSNFGPTTTQPPASLFGTTQPQPQSNLFGTNPQKPSDSLFGAPAGATKPPSLFAPQPTTQPQQPSNLFGSTFQPQPKQAPNVFGGSTLNMGQSTASQGPLNASNTQTAGVNTTISGVKIDLSNIRPTTRFQDLVPELQQVITKIDNDILTQQRHAAEVSQLFNSMFPLVESIAPDVEFVTQKLSNTELALSNDAVAIQNVRGLVRRDAAEARVSFRALDSLKLPEQFRSVNERDTRDARDIFNLSQYENARQPQSKSVSLPATATTVLDSADYFDKNDVAQPQNIEELYDFRAMDMGAQLEFFQAQIKEIELHLRGVEAVIAQKSRDIAVNGGRKADGNETARQVVGALREIDNGIKAVGGRVEEVREEARDVMGTGVDGIEKVLVDGGVLRSGERWLGEGMGRGVDRQEGGGYGA